MSDEVSVGMSIPLDGDGFLRRECPTCERELKWHAAQDDEEETPAPDGGYYCPYCAVQAAPDAWWTKAQLAAANALLYDEVVEPELKRFQGEIEKLNHPGGLIQLSSEISRGEDTEASDLSETDDMRLVDFACHEEPVKVLDDWNGPVHCPICGQPA
jgi:hypothetical protein